jgi:phosphate transport system substrate-binding protein
MRQTRIGGLAAAFVLVASIATTTAYLFRETVVVDGSSTVFRISRAAQYGFRQVNPDVTIAVNVQGTGGGFRKYLAGQTDIVDASRPATASEEAAATQNADLAWTRFVVGYDGITVVVNPKNQFVKSLSVAQLKALWEPGGKIKTWKDLDPTWPDRTIVLYCPDNASGTFDYFTEAICGEVKLQRKDVQASPDDNNLVRGVSGDPNAVGYFGYAYYAANKSKLRAIPVQGGPSGAAVMPSAETILDKSYSPLSRPLYIYVKNSALRRPGASAFVKYYLENIETLATKGGYVPPTGADQSANHKALGALGLAAAR